MLKINNISFSYGEKQILRDFSLEICENDRLWLYGESGCGKTTLLKSILGLIRPLNGGVELGDYLEIGYFEQEMSPDVNTTCLEEIWNEFPAYSQYEVRSALAKCGLTTKHIESLVRVLSGGEQAKVRLCKLVNKETNILLLDEPNAALDLPGKADIRSYLSFYKEHGGTIIMATHEETDLELCEQVLCLRDGICYPIEKTLRGQALLKEMRFHDAKDKDLVSSRI